MNTTFSKKEINDLNRIIDKNSKRNSQKYQLSPNSFSNEDMIEGIKIMVSKKITMSKKTRLFEEKFAKFLGCKYAIMVNSGSSANLLAMFALINPLKKNKLKSGDECLIPSLCWSTSLWPIIQAGLKPKFVDVDPLTLNFSIKDLKKKISKKTKAVLVVHVLGNSTNMSELMRLKRKYRFTLIEDTCESLGSKYKDKYLGSYGEFGTFSFYYSHQITSGEGGMIVCNDLSNYKILHSLRAHGWDRGLTNTKDNFNFINSGFNLRPTDITASIGNSQFSRLDQFISIRKKNREKIIDSLKKSNKWKKQYEFLKINKKVSPSFFGFPIIISEKYKHLKKKLLSKLDELGIESRPIISGNFLNQPAAKVYKFEQKAKSFPNSQIIEDRGFFIGLHTKPITSQKLNLLTNSLLSIDNLNKKS